MPEVDVDEIDTLWATWDAVPGATSYLVGVYTERGSEVRFPNLRSVGDVTQLKLGELTLAQGARYVISVQAVGPEGPGLEGRSDGVTVRDTRPPIAGVTVTPEVAWPAGGVRARAEGRCDDRGGLAHFAMRLEQDGALVTLLEERMIGGTVSTRSSVTIDGTTLPVGTYAVRVICRDRTGLTSEASARLVLDRSAVPPPSDGGVSSDGGPLVRPADGCGCRVGARSSGRSLLLVLLDLALVVLRRRARRCARASA